MELQNCQRKVSEFDSVCRVLTLQNHDFGHFQLLQEHVSGTIWLAACDFLLAFYCHLTRWLHCLLLQEIQIDFTFLVLPFWWRLTRVLLDNIQEGEGRKMVVCVCVCNTLVAQLLRYQVPHNHTSTLSLNFLQARCSSWHPACSTKAVNNDNRPKCRL